MSMRLADCVCDRLDELIEANVERNGRFRLRGGGGLRSEVLGGENGVGLTRVWKEVAVHVCS